MARKSEQSGFFDQARTWWETDTAKAIATIIAVLLIPASVIAWNYATNRAEENGERLGALTEEENSEESENNGDNGEEEVSNDENGEVAATETEQTDGQEPSDQAGIGGLEDVQELPDTTSTYEYEYIVQPGDNVYSISINVCGNESYYKSNLRKGYLKVGQVLNVTCN